MSYGEVPLPKPRKSPKGNTESDGQAAHDITVRFEKRGRSATHAAEPQEACALLHPLQGASFLSTPLQGGILKPPALRVVVDWRVWKRLSRKRAMRAHGETNLASGEFLHGMW